MSLDLVQPCKEKMVLQRCFKMFLGEIIYKEKRDATDEVLVKAVEFKTSDEEFNETEYDYRGNPQYSKMITKLCTYNHRCEFILKVLKRDGNISRTTNYDIGAKQKYSGLSS